MIGFKTPIASICLVILLSLSLGLTTQVHANNDHHDEVFVTFFHSPAATAGWVHFTPAPTGDPDDWSIKLLLPTGADYAGAVLHNVAGPPPSSPPSFDFRSSVTSIYSGGSPRLVMCFNDGANCSSRMELRPLAWVANTWTTENGLSSDWDNNGGTCGFVYEHPYAFEIACHPGATVTDVFVVTDSAWICCNTSGYTHYIDNIHYGAAFITRPGEGCQESDGNGDFQGQQNGNFNFDNDGCIDGDQNQVSSTNRGDGRDFQSTQITTSTFDATANTVTITGVGTSNGIPVTFVFVALETGPTTPGWVSFAFSDGYTNAGTLVNGNILLH